MSSSTAVSSESGKGERGYPRSASRWAAAFVVAATFGGVAPAQADEPKQEQAPTFEAKSQPRPFSDMVQEIVVTARKREERVQLVPVAVTAFTGEDTARRNLRRMESLDGLVPNLLVTTTLGSANSGRVALRGVGQGEPTSTAEPAVGVYVDGVYQARFQAALPTLGDVERVEVLRGPQGTLFGKNAIGGAVNVVTARPSFDFGGNAEVRFGSYDMMESRLAVNIPLVPERAAARLSFATATRDGYVTNVFNGDKYADNKMLAGRAQLLMLPREDVEVLIGLERSREDRKPQGSKCVLSAPNNTTSGIIAQASGLRSLCAEDAKRSEFKFSSDLTFAEDNQENTAVTSRISWDVGADLTLASISGWRRQEAHFAQDLDGTALPILQVQDDNGRDVQDQFSQELQLTGRSMQGKLRYVLGLYGFKEEASERDNFGGSLAPLTLVRGPTGAPVINPLTRQPVLVPFLGTNLDPRGLVAFARLPLVNRELEVDNFTYAAYGQATYALTSKLDLTVGLRRTQERKRFKRDSRFVACPTNQITIPSLIPLLPCTPAGQPGSIIGNPTDSVGFAERSGRNGDWSPMASLGYSLTPDVLLYASYGNAFRSGGFNGNATRVSELEELDPEDMTSYELGVKSTFFDGRFRFNAAGFYNIVENFRVPFSDLDQVTGLPAITQAEADRILIRGGEVEMALIPVDGLQLSASVGVLRGEYDDFTPPTGTLSDDERIADAPNYTMSFNAAYQRPVGSLGDLEIRLNWLHRGSNQSDFIGIEETEVSKVGLLSGRIALALPDGRTEVAAFGTNLLNRIYFDNGINVVDSFGYALRTYAPPRLWGVEVRHRF